jgi:hypothetical protein
VRPSFRAFLAQSTSLKVATRISIIVITLSRRQLLKTQRDHMVVTPGTARLHESRFYPQSYQLPVAAAFTKFVYECSC